MKDVSSIVNISKIIFSSTFSDPESIDSFTKLMANNILYPNYELSIIKKFELHYDAYKINNKSTIEKDY